MSHVDKLEYGWWEKKRELPTTIGDKRNYVINPVELCEYVDALAELKAAVDREYTQAALTHKALYKGRLLSWEGDPTLFTLAHVMEFFIKVGKCKLRMTNLLVYMTRERVNANANKGERNGNQS